MQLLGLIVGMVVAYGGQYAMKTSGSPIIFIGGRPEGTWEAMLFFVVFQMVVLFTAAYIAYRISASRRVIMTVIIFNIMLLFLPIA